MKILKLRPKNYQPILKLVSQAIKKGKVVVCPTDTVYGLLADAYQKKAIENLFKIKKRPKEKAVPIFVKDLKLAKKLAKIDKTQQKFLKKFWPGKVTFVLKRKNNLPSILFGKKKTIGLRIPNYKFINQLLFKVDRPLTGTSANISGFPPSTKIKEVLKQFRNQKYQPDLIIDAGNLKPSLPSTVIDLTQKKPKILRVGEVKVN